MDTTEALLESWDRQSRIVNAVATRVNESNRKAKPSIDGMPLDQQLAHVLAGLARVPALICLDDVHLAGAEEVWLGVLRRLSQGPARLLLISREALPLAGLAQIRLGGLDQAEALALVAGASVALEPGLVQRLLAKTASSDSTRSAAASAWPRLTKLCPRSASTSTACDRSPAR